jgi:hypothetical protein
MNPINYCRAHHAALSGALLSLFVLLVPPGVSRAEFVIDIGDATVSPGGATTVPVYIRSTLAAGEPLNNFSFSFQLDTLGPTQLNFLDPQFDSQLTQPNYVFGGNSTSLVFPPVGVVTTTVVPNDTFIGGDATFDGLSAVVPQSDVLLALLNFTTLTALPPEIGNVFSVSLTANDNTAFYGEVFGPAVGFTSTTGTVTVVPEPTAAWLMAVGAAVCALRRARWASAILIALFVRS